MTALELPDRCPPFLARFLQPIIDHINRITPLAGLGVDVDEKPDGMEIATEIAKTTQKTGANQQFGGGGSGGTPVDIAGAQNGAPAIFHLLQTAPADPLPLP